jgi:DNA adenine methylase
MTIGALAPWFGAKRTMAPAIIAELGPHHAYWEIFCGSMAVLMAKPPSRTEIVNDLHRDLVNLARCVRDAGLGPELYRRLRRTLCCQETFKAALAAIREHDPADPAKAPDVERAFDYFVASWQGMNGVAGTSAFNTNFARRFSTSGGDAGARWIGVVRSIPAWRKRLRGVQVFHSDGIELAGKIEDKDGVVIYADPPYLVKGAKYLHDFAEADHARLAEALRRFRKTRVVVSYYADPRLQDLYPGWTICAVDVTKNLVNSGKNGDSGATKAPEVLLINGPSLASGATPLFHAEDR